MADGMTETLEHLGMMAEARALADDGDRTLMDSLLAEFGCDGFVHRAAVVRARRCPAYLARSFPSFKRRLIEAFRLADAPGFTPSSPEHRLHLLGEMIWRVPVSPIARAPAYTLRDWLAAYRGVG